MRTNLDHTNLQAIAVFSLLTNHVQHIVYEFSTLGVVAFRPIVASATLSEYEVVGTKELPVGAIANAVHRARL
jgi:hypothetical protein